MMMKKNILVVDDIEEYVMTLEVLLSDLGDVTGAYSYKDAINILKNKNIDMAIIDIRLSEDDPENTDGLKLLDWIKNNKPDVTCFVMSAYKDFDYAVQALNLGAKYFFKKPLKHEEIFDIINKYLSDK